MSSETLIERACILANTRKSAPRAFAVPGPLTEIQEELRSTKSSGKVGESWWIESLPESVDLRAIVSSIEKN